MVSHQAELAALGDEAGALVRIRSVADHVAKAPQLLEAGALDVGKHRLEGRQVRVDIAEDRQSHEPGGIS